MAFLKDIRRPLSTGLYDILSTIGIGTYTVIPQDIDNPFIYIGNITTFDFGNKCKFITQGTVDIEMHTGSNGWNGSMDELYGYIEQIKALLQNEKGATIDLGVAHKMVLWKIQGDTGLVVYDPINRLMASTITYEFSIYQKITYKDRVEDDEGIVESINCVPLQLR